MAFNVGAIVSKLTLDKSGWNQAVKGVGADQQKMQGMSEQTAMKFKKMGMAMTVAGGAIIGALGGMTKKFVDAGDEIDKTSRRTGIAAEALSELKYAAELSGASLSDVEKGIKRMSGTILDAHAGLETYERAFRQMGVSIDDLMKMNPEQQFIHISEAIAQIEDPTIRAALAQDVFGRAGTALLPMFDQGAEGLKQMREEAKATGVVFSQDAARSAAALKDAQHELSQTVKGLGMSIVKDLAPALTDLIKSMSGTIQKVVEWVKENPQLTMTIVKITGAVGGALTVLGPMLIILPKLVAGAKLLAGGFTALISPIGLVTAALAALAIGYMKVKAAQEAAEESSRRYDEQNKKLMTKLEESAKAAGMTTIEFAKLREEYDNNSAALAMAIKHGEEGVELQKALAEHTSDYEVEAKKAAEASQDLDISMDDLTGRFQGYINEVEIANEKTKTWVDYIESLGVKTVEEKGNRVKELTGYLDDLKEAYDKGLISLKDYVESTNKATSEIEELTTELTTSTIPAARDMAVVYEESNIQMKNQTADFTEHLQFETEKQATIWSESLGVMGTSLADNLKGWLAGYQSLGDALKNIWTDLKDTFVNNLVDMGLSWSKDFIGGMLSSAKEGFGTVTDTVKNLGKGVVDTIKGFSPGGIASGVIGGAVSGLVSGLVGGFPKASQNHLKDLVQNSTNILDTLRIDFRDNQYNWFLDRYDRMLEALYGVLPRKFDAVNKRLDKIRDYTAYLKDMVSAQGGAIATEPTLAVLHGTSSNPEIAAPLADIMKIAQMGPIGGGTANLRQNINVNIMVKDQLDPYSAQRIVRQQIVPETLKAIELDSKNKTKIRNILGIQV